MTDERAVSLSLDDEPGPARRLPEAAARALVEQALARFEPTALVRPRPRRISPAAAVMLGIVLASASAGASYVAFNRLIGAPAPAPAQRDVPARRAPRPRPDRTVAVTVMATPPVVVAARPAEVPAARAPDLAAANRLRAAGAWPAAHRAYAGLASLRTAEGRAAALAAAALELEHLGRPAAALRRYSALATSPSPAIAEEAAWGVVECRRRMGDRDGEAQALRSFLARHPASLLNARAQAALRALDRR